MWWLLRRGRKKQGDAERREPGASDGSPEDSGKPVSRRMSRRWTSCPAQFEVGGRRISGRMCSVSKSGAQFRLDTSRADVEIEPGTELDISVRTPYGEIVRRGSVKWSRKDRDFNHFGVDFGRLPDGDPLRDLADSPF